MGDQKSAFFHLQNATSVIDETWPKVGEYGLSSYGIGQYAGKIFNLLDNPLNHLKNNRIKKTKGFRA